MEELASAVRTAAKEFADGVWPVLVQERVLPVPRFARHLKVGHDYFGPSLHEQVQQFEAVLTQQYSRFSEDRPLGEREFPGPFIFSFLEYCISLVALEADGLTLSKQILDTATSELLESLGNPEESVACVRTVAHLTTHDRMPITFGDVEIVPVTGPAHSQRGSIAAIHEGVAYGAGAYLERKIGGSMYAPPEAVVIARGSGASPFDATAEASGSINEFLNAIRLLFASTSQGPFEIRGGVRPIRQHGLNLVEFIGERPGFLAQTSMVRRTTVLRPEDGPSIAGVTALIGSLPDLGDGMHFSSLALASHKFTMSYHPHRWWDQLVDLTTALEGALSGKDKTDVLLRLRTRAAALLSTDSDPAGAIFADLGILYALRSSLVHGGDLKTKELRKAVLKVSTVPDTAMFGVAIAFAMDRLRDLVRRSLLCRYALGVGDVLWPVSGEDQVDARLADTATREVWRSRWRATMSDLGAESAADPAPPAVDHLTHEE